MSTLRPLLAYLNRSGDSRRVGSLRSPSLHLGLDPGYGAGTEMDRRGKTVCADQCVQARLREPCDCLYLGEAQEHDLFQPSFWGRLNDRGGDRLKIFMRLRRGHRFVPLLIHSTFDQTFRTRWLTQHHREISVSPILPADVTIGSAYAQLTPRFPLCSDVVLLHPGT